MVEKGRKGKKSRFGKEYKGTCRICGCEGYTEMHHIINQHYARLISPIRDKNKV